MIDNKPYKIFNELKKKFTNVVVVIDQNALALTGTHVAFKNHREYIAHKFKEKGVEVTRWHHNYRSLDGHNPELGLVYLANDSVIHEALEVHALIGHNAKYTGG